MILIEVAIKCWIYFIFNFDQKVGKEQFQIANAFVKAFFKQLIFVMRYIFATVEQIIPV